jgi:hypothetical protein
MPKCNKGFVLHFDPQGNSVNLVHSGENSYFVILDPETHQFRIMNNRTNSVVLIGSSKTRKGALAKISKALLKLLDRDKILTSILNVYSFMINIFSYKKYIYNCSI